MLKREKKYDFIKYGQSDFTEPYLEKKAQKKTVQEQCYLHFLGKMDFDTCYFSVAGSRKVFFVTMEIVELVMEYDKAEMEFARNPDHPDRKNTFFDFMEDFVGKFENALSDYFAKAAEIYDSRKLAYYAGNFFADEARKLVALIMDSETDAGDFFVFKMNEAIAKYRRKIAFKNYEKYAKKMLKDDVVPYDTFRRFAESYLKASQKLKANYRIKMLNLLGSNVRKFREPQNLTLFESFFR